MIHFASAANSMVTDNIYKRVAVVYMLRIQVNQPRGAIGPFTFEFLFTDYDDAAEELRKITEKYTDRTAHIDTMEVYGRKVQ